jgi:GNAT superfamily N-acetyltransferase
MGINYRLLDSGSDTEIQQWLDLYRICFHETMDRDYWYWLHEKNPIYRKTKPLVFIAEVNSRIIGSVSVIPSQNLVKTHQNQYFLDSCYIYGIMVHPEFRRQGISSTILKNIINFTKDEGYDLLTVCSTNLYSYQSLVHAGFTCLTSFKKSKGYLSMNGLMKNYLPILPQQISKTLGFPLSGIFTLLFPKISHNLQVRYGDIPEFIGEIDKIHRADYTHSGVHGGRTPPYIQWRFSAPGICSKCLSLWEGGKMIAYIIFDYPDPGKNVLIEDLFALKDDEYLISILVSEAVAILKKANADSVWTYLMEREGIHSKIFSQRHGFISHSSGLKTLPMARFLYLPLKENLNHEIFSDEKQWNLMAADSWFFEKSDY